MDIQKAELWPEGSKHRRPWNSHRLAPSAPSSRLTTHAQSVFSFKTITRNLQDGQREKQQ